MRSQFHKAAGIPVVFIFICVLAVGFKVHAQGNQGQVLSLVKDAMNDYSNLMIDDSMTKLNQALTLATQSGVTGSTLARVHVNIGIVQAGGFMNNAEALNAFKRAICIDPNIQPDPLVSTPDIQTTFQLAKTQVQSPKACQALGVGPAPVAPPVQEVPMEAQPPEQPVEEQPIATCANHVPVTEQARMYPIPLYVELEPTMEMSLGKVKLFYKNEGEATFREKEMTKRGSGFGAKIDCDSIREFDPRIVYYYIWILDAGGNPLCQLGTSDNPNMTNMVDQLNTEPPSFPGASPEKRCEACPPWDPKCGGGMASQNAQLGDPCNDMNQCAEGLKCQNGVCVEGEEGGGGGGKKYVHIDVGFGTGAGIVSQAMKLPYDPYHTTAEQRSVDVGGGFAWSPLQGRIGVGYYILQDLSLDLNFRANLYFNKRTEYKCNKPGVNPEDPCREWATIGSGANKQYQTSEITEPMAWLLTLRARYIFLQSGGLDMWAYGGLGYGSIKHRVVFQDQITEGPDKGATRSMKVFPESGTFDIAVGPGLAYYFVDFFGILFELPIDILIPHFALNLDLNVGFSFRF